MSLQDDSELNSEKGSNHVEKVITNILVCFLLLNILIFQRFRSKVVICRGISETSYKLSLKGPVDDAVSNGSPLSCDTSVNYSPPSTPMTLKAPPSTPVNSARISESVLKNSATRNPTRQIRYRDRRGD